MKSFFEDFSFSKAISTAIDVGADFFMGKESSVYDTATGKTITTKGDGFLDTAFGLVSKGAKAYVAMQDDDSAPIFQTPEAPEFKAVRKYRQMSGSAAPTVGYRPTNRIYQDAILRRMRQMNFEKNLERLTANYTVRPTTRRKAPETPGKATIKRKMTAPTI